MNGVEKMRRRIAEIQAKSDAYLAARIPGYDPEKAKAAREKLREMSERAKAKNRENPE